MGQRAKGGGGVIGCRLDLWSCDVSGDLGTPTVASLRFAQDGAFVPIVEILMVASVFFSCIA